MTTNFFTYYKASCRTVLQPMGFRFYGENQVRVVGDVLQSVYLHRSRALIRSTIEFGALPLCSGISKDNLRYINCQLDLGNLAKGYPFFEYSPGDGESMVRCVDEIMDCIKKELIPFFNKATNSSSAYEEIMRVKKRYLPESELNLLTDYGEFCFLLKAERHDLALKYLLEMQNQHNHAYEANQKLISSDPEYKKTLDAHRDELDNFIAQIRANNIDFVRQFIAKNEQMSREALNMG